MKGEQHKPEFKAINPQHCVPTLVDGDLKIWESRAISCYLVNQYGKNDQFYPKEPKKRALVDRLLYFDQGTLYGAFMKYAYPTTFMGAPVEEGSLDKLHVALDHLEYFLADSDYACGDHITIADHALAASVETFKASDVDINRHKTVASWLQRCKANMPAYDKNEEGAKQFGDLVKAGMAKLAA